MSKYESHRCIIRRSSEGWSPAPLTVKLSKSHWIPACAGMTLFLFCHCAFALETPHTGKFDKRVSTHQLPS